MMLVLAACGDKENNSASAGSTTGATDTAASTSTGSNADTSASEPTTTPTQATTQASDSATSTATTGVATTDATSASGSTGAVDCQIEPPDPGQCNGGKPASAAAPRFTGPRATGGQHPGPGPLLDPPEEVFASTSGGFIMPTDVGDGFECDIFGDDCGPGEKCNAWANDGGGSWNATKCFPAGTDPIGAPCTVEGSGVSGIDSCVKGAMCWDIDTDTGMGVCVEQCTCSLDNPVCTTPNTICTISNNGVLVLCLPVCDPLDQGACADGDVCVASDNLFICVLDASGDVGGVNDPCEYVNACDPGFLCSNSGVDCGGSGCCTPYCDLDAPVCPGGTECTPYYAPGEAPKCFEDIGVCFTP
ncbi:hypothetical protein [Nannocystis sp.]|uniref:hypothetical protein n=1 Tax=Nannocystis sp. TaxID=1962667 RepID=UPI0025FDB77B|nr:hypothetical protein [Nannocystis sp.]MBK7829684.1 hypothetical protein [Nannocystis sp.]